MRTSGDGWAQPDEAAIKFNALPLPAAAALTRPRPAWRPVPSRLGMPSQLPSQSAAQLGAPLQLETGGHALVSW